MTGQQRDFEEVLSRVLHTTTDQVEPVGDGLTKIRGRLAEPWLKRQWWLLCSELMMLRWLVVVRSESFFSTVRSRFAATDVTAADAGTAATGAGGRRGPLPLFGGILAWASAKSGPGGGQRRPPGPVMNWLRPALAVAGAVVLVVAGVFALGQIREGIVSLSNGSSVITPGSSGQGGQNGGPNGSASRSSAGSRSPSSRGSHAPKRGVSQHVGASSSPSPCATPSSSPQSSPSASSSPPPSPTPSPSSSPTTSPTSSPTPTPTNSPPLSGYQSPAPVGGYQPGGNGTSTMALVCTQPGPSPSGSPA